MSFICNITGSIFDIIDETKNREGALFENYNSRFRMIYLLLTKILYNQIKIIKNLKPNKNIKGIGIIDSDWTTLCEEKYNYKNVLKEENFNIYNHDSIKKYNNLDFIIASEMIQHIDPYPNIQIAFDNLYMMLKNGGSLIFSVPYTDNEHIEYYPLLYNYILTPIDNNECIINNTTINGISQKFNIKLHNNKIIMRMFSKKSIIEYLERAGFKEIIFHEVIEEYNNYGIFWGDQKTSYIITAKKICENILYYGNCQTFAIKNILNLKNVIEKNIECHSTTISKDDFDSLLINADVIITQSISDNYRNLDYLSTKYILSKCKKDCKIIIFDSCYFNLYHFDLTYKVVNNIIIKEPVDYHYNNLLQCYQNNLPFESFLEIINNKNFKTQDELEIIANNTLTELLKRYYNNIEKYKNDNIYIISTYEYIKNNYKKKLLFYSMNHPTKDVLQYIAEQIITILKFKNTINYNIDPLSGIKCILYKCLENIVDFNVDDYEPKIFNAIYNLNNNYDIVKLYYDTYNNIKLIN